MSVPLRVEVVVGRYRPDRDGVSAYVEQLVAALASKPPVAVRLGNAAFAAAQETPLAPGLEAMQAQLSLLNTTHDAGEGVRAFL